MSSDWQETTLGIFAEINPKRTIKKDAVAPFIEMAALPTFSRDVINADVVERKFTGGGAKFTNGDTLLARITPCLENGKTALVSCLPQNINGYGSTEFIVLAPRSDIDINYLYYLARSDEFRAYAISRMEGTSGRQRVPNNAVAQFSFICPPEYDRKLIGDFLASLDDRIALLRETNATLEAIAQAMFKSWFVDFEPVHAKQQGRAPEGMDAATAVLFPDSFEKSELGLVPNGWKVVPIGDVVEIVGGGTPNTKELSYWENGEHCWTTPKDLSGIHAPVLLTTERKLSTNGLAKVSSGLLPAGTLLLSSRAPIGYLAIAQVPMAINQGYIAMLPNSQLPPLFMLFWCQQNMEVIEGRANGSTFMEISKKAFRPIPVLVPALPVLDKFMDTVDALFNRLVENEQQAQTLATLRDTLLPRLISGQLRLPEAEAVLKAASA